MAEEEEVIEVEDDGGSGGSKLTLIVGIVNLLVSFGIIGVLFMTLQKEQKGTNVEDIAVKTKEEGKDGEKGGEKTAEGGEADSAADLEEQFGRMLPLQKFTVNLSSIGSASPKFARVKISLEIPSEDSEAELTRKMPRVRNTIIDLFNSKRPNDLVTPEGRNYLKEEIRNAINGFLLTGKVKGVFFTSFALSS